MKGKKYLILIGMVVFFSVTIGCFNNYSLEQIRKGKIIKQFGVTASITWELINSIDEIIKSIETKKDINKEELIKNDKGYLEGDYYIEYNNKTYLKNVYKKEVKNTTTKEEFLKGAEELIEDKKNLAVLEVSINDKKESEIDLYFKGIDGERVLNEREAIEFLYNNNIVDKVKATIVVPRNNKINEKLNRTISVYAVNRIRIFTGAINILFFFILILAGVLCLKKNVVLNCFGKLNRLKIEAIFCIIGSLVAITFEFGNGYISNIIRGLLITIIILWIKVNLNKEEIKKYGLISSISKTSLTYTITVILYSRFIRKFVFNKKWTMKWVIPLVVIIIAFMCIQNINAIGGERIIFKITNIIFWVGLVTVIVFIINRCYFDYINLRKAFKNSKHYESIVFSELLKNVEDSKGQMEEATKIAIKNKKLNNEIFNRSTKNLEKPLNKIIESIDYLYYEKDIKSIACDIEKRGIELKESIEDVFEVSKAITGNLKIDKIEGDLNFLIKEIILGSEELLKSNKVILKENLSKEQCKINIDIEKMHRALDGLIYDVIKKSLENSRIYIESYIKNDKYNLIIKSVSKEEISIDGDKLMWILKNKDSDRNIMIAKGYIEAQGGILQIDVDGDLIKYRMQLDI